MFNIDKAIAAWRRQLKQAGLGKDVIDELETHLRDEFEQQLPSLSDGERAFEKAVQLLGDAAKLREEFAPRRSFMRAICFLSAGAILLINGWALILLQLTVVERFVGALALAATTLGLVAIPFLPQLLSLAAYQRFVRIMKAAAFIIALFPLILLVSLSGLIDLESRHFFTLIGWLAFAAIAVAVFAIDNDNRWRGTDILFLSSKLESPQLLEVARAEAQGLGHHFIGTEHLLLALLKESHPETILPGWKSDYDSVRVEVEQLVGLGGAPNTSMPLALTPRALKALQIAQREAARLHQALVTPGNVLSGLMIEGTGVAAKVLRKRRRPSA